MYLKIHKSYKSVIALADEHIVGKKFEEKIRQIDVRESFYKGQQVNQEQALEILKKQFIEDSTFNVVGKEATETAIKAGIASKQDIGEIAGIPLLIII